MLTPKCKSDYTKEYRESIVQFIKNYADHHAIALPGRLPQFKNYKVMKLPSCDAKISIYRRYIEACKDKEEKLIGERCFYYLWNECCPYIQTMKFANDLCDTFKENTNRISEAKNSDEREERLNIALSHLRTAKDQRASYTKCITDDTDAIVISFDYAQNVAYPASPQTTGAAYFKSARRSCLFGILDGKRKVQTNFLVDESHPIGKGPNSVIRMLHHFLEKHPAGHIIAFADNCVSQNKNNAMLRYLCWRVRTNLNKTISLNFLISGQTKFGPDRMFGLIKMKYSRGYVDCFDDLVQCVNESSIKALNVSINGQDIDWRDWDNFLKDSYSTLPGITKFHHFAFHKKDEITCKKYVDSEEKVFVLRTSEIMLDKTPGVIKPLGLSIERQWYLFNEIRLLCSDVKKADKLAPKPMLPKPKKNEKTVSKDIKKKKPALPENKNTKVTKQEKRPSTVLVPFSTSTPKKFKKCKKN